MNWSLQKISELLHVDCGSPEIMITGVSIDTRSLKQGDLFFALPGDKSDGHQYVGTAFEKGCAAAIIQMEGFIEESVENQCLRVSDPMIALQKLSHAYRKQFDIPVIAITGSNGKTTTKEMLADVLGTKYNIAKSPGNWNNHLGVPLSIFEWTNETNAAILEMGTNHFGEIKCLAEISEPTHAVITNIGKGHMEFFHTLEGVAKAKVELLESLDNGIALLNGDDNHLKPYLSMVDTTYTFGMSDGCNFQVKSVEIDEKGCGHFQLKDMNIELSIPGKYQIYNAMVAASMGLLLDVGPSMIQQTLKAFQSTDKRMQSIEHQGFLILNDCYNANPTSLKAAIATLQSITKFKRRIVVLGDMLELGEESRTEHVNTGLMLSAHDIDACFCYGPEMKITVDVAKQSGIGEAYHYDHHETLIHDLKSFVRSGDGILVKGSRSMKMEVVVEGLLR